MLDLSSNAYLYAQALDNSGNTEYWVLEDSGAKLEKLEPHDLRLRLLRATIDATRAATRCFSSSSGDIEGRAQLSGDCVIAIRPVTLDVDGRVSPVLLVTNIYGEARMQVTTAIRAIPDVLGRGLSAHTNAEIKKLERELSRRPWVQLFRLFVAKLRSTKL